MSDMRERVCDMGYCTNCGSELEADAKFCTNCGAAVETSSGDANAAEQPTQTMPTQPTSQNAMPQGSPVHNASASPVPQPSVQAAATGQPPMQPPASGAGPSKSENRLYIVVIVVAVMVLLALVVGGVIGYHRLSSLTKGGSSVVASASPSETTDASTPSSTPSETAITLDADKLQSIVSGYSETEAAVSVIPVGENDEFDSRQANTKFVAAGLYLPVYLAAKDSGNSGAVSSAETMMRTMDNDSGNAAVSDLGGLSALNGWLGGAGYSNTDFQRAFGDVEASNSGYENYTSAADAAKMLAATAEDGGTNLLSYDLASEGVTMPSGVTLNGHRGQGIKNSYNFFILMKTGKTTMAVSVLTQNLGKDTAVSLTNDILAEVASEVK